MCLFEPEVEGIFVFYFYLLGVLHLLNAQEVLGCMCVCAYGEDTFTM